VIHILIFYALLLLACGYAGWRGGAPERLVAVILVAGTAATWGVTMGRGGGRADHFLDLETSVLLVDAAMLVALLAVALLADRFWPLWITALQGFGVVSHIAKAIAPEILPNVYQIVQAFIAYPGLLLLIAATRWHRRRLREDGADPSWSTSWRSSTPRVPASVPMRY
jgi:hypothetical protein